MGFWCWGTLIDIGSLLVGRVPDVYPAVRLLAIVQLLDVLSAEAGPTGWLGADLPGPMVFLGYRSIRLRRVRP